MCFDFILPFLGNVPLKERFDSLKQAEAHQVEDLETGQQGSPDDGGKVPPPRRFMTQHTEPGLKVPPLAALYPELRK